jgi:hypothetical protein
MTLHSSIAGDGGPWRITGLMAVREGDRAKSREANGMSSRARSMSGCGGREDGPARHVFPAARVDFSAPIAFRQAMIAMRANAFYFWTSLT